MTNLSRVPPHDTDAVRDGGHNLWDYWVLSPEPFKGAHFACFPTELPRRCIKAATKPGDLVLDPFCGSGTTCAVAEDLGRLWLGFDISAEYRELQNKRTEQVSLTGKLIGGQE